MRAKIRDTELYFDVDGAGLVIDATGVHERLTAFPLNGGPGIDHIGLRGSLEPFSAHLQIVYHDYRGHGRSAKGDPHSYTLDEHVEDLEALRRHLGVGPIVSIGNSYGGEVAMAHAARYPDAVSHLVLVATASHGGNSARAKENVRARGTAEQIDQCDRFFAGEIDTLEKIRAFLKVMSPLYTTQPVDPAAMAAALEHTTFYPDAFNRAHGPSGFQRSVDLRPELKNITAPTLILAGRHDPMCPPDFSEEIHALIPGSDLHIFESSSHLIASDEPERFYDVITNFVVPAAR